MSPTTEQSTWYESWFDSPYYHLMYGHRDETEAENFVNRLVDFLAPAPGSRALDLACGKGRHAMALHRRGLDVIGLDLSEHNIESAKRSEQDGLSFYVHDMRYTFMVNYFDYTFNLFTSFGYFSSQRENHCVVAAVKSGLKRGGIFVIDFMNAQYVKNHVAQKSAGVTHACGIAFHWKKRIENGFVIKNISFEAENKQFSFVEQVQLLELPDFEKLLAPYFTIENTFGDYNLGKFDAETSPRLILVTKKRDV